MKTLAILVLVAALKASCQAPPEIQAMNSLPNAAQLYLVYCSADNHSCVTREAICYGQCGNQSEADDMGYGCSGDISGRVPAHYHYAKWFAVSFETGKKVSGLAAKNYNTKDCHNPR